MPKPKSAGLLMYRIRDGELQVLIVHPGGPYWARKDAGAWFIPKGEIEDVGSSAFAAKLDADLEHPADPGGALHLFRDGS